jgi:cell volume regulation protein A
VNLDLTLLAAGALLVVSVFASRASGRLGVPALLVFVAVGMLAGSEGPGGIYFDDVMVTQWIGVIALAYILFAGGLDTDWKTVRPILGQAVTLATAGVLVTAALVGWFAHAVLDFTLLEGFLLGAIVSSTDAAAVFAVLRSRGISLPPRLRSLLELESGSNDPMAVFLTGAAITLIQKPDLGWGSLAADFVLQMVLGGIAGVLLGRLAVLIINRIDLEYEGLYPVLTLGWVLVVYAAASAIGGNGFLAVYVAGIAMSSRRFLHRRKLLRFHDGVAWLMQIAMFLTLGLLVFPSQLVPVVGVSLLIAFFLILVARPVAVFATLLPARVRFREQTLLGWVGLRGAVPIVLATFPLLAGIEQSTAIFNIVFFIVLTSVLVQGTTIPLVARLLGLAEGENREGPLPLRRESELVTLGVPPDGFAVGKMVVEIPLPPDTLILLVHREGGFFAPDGSTRIEAGDKLMIFTSRQSVDGVRTLVEMRAQQTS